MGFKYPLHGWDKISKKLPSGFILPYGIMFIFYLVLPVAFIVFGNVFETYTFFSSQLLASIFVKFVPFICLVLYWAFVIYLIICMFRMKKLYNLEITKL